MDHRRRRRSHRNPANVYALIRPKRAKAARALDDTSIALNQHIMGEHMTEATTIKQIHPSFLHNQYLLQSKILKSIGGDFYFYGADGQLLLYSKQKAFKLREDIRVYADETMAEELLTIKAPKILDINAVYNVVDATSGEAVGALKRKGIKSIIMDEWLFLSPDGTEVGNLKEVSLLAALASRWIALIPQSYSISASGQPMASLKQRFNPFLLKYDMTVVDPTGAIDRRLLIAAGTLLMGIEGRQG